MDIYVYIEGPIILRIGYFSGPVYVHPYSKSLFSIKCHVLLYLLFVYYTVSILKLLST